MFVRFLLSSILLAFCCGPVSAQDYWAKSGEEVSPKLVPLEVEGEAVASENRVANFLSLKPTERVPESVYQPVTGKGQAYQTAGKLVVRDSGRVDHKRLLFEEKCLERYGLSKAPFAQTVESSLKFFKSGIVFPVSWLKGDHRRCYDGR